MEQEKKIKEIISNIFEISEEEITDESSNETIETWDSLNHLNLMVSLEDHFGITITEEEMMEMISYSEIIRVLKDKKVL